MSAMILDPLPSGVTSVTELRLYASSDRTGTPVVAPVAQVDGAWTADLLNVPPGRWWPTVVAVKDAAQYTYPRDRVDLPVDPTLVVSPETVAVKAGIPLPLTDGQRETILEAIRDAQSDVVGYLGRGILPTTRVETGRWSWGEDWNLQLLDYDPLIRILSAVPEPDPVSGEVTGYFTVTYLAGIDAATDPDLSPIRRYVVAHTLNSPDVTGLWKTVTGAKGEVRSLSAEGQSVSFAAPTLSGVAVTGTKPGDLTPGSLPTLASLDRWRVAGRRVHQGPTKSSDWPFTGDRW